MNKSIKTFQWGLNFPCAHSLAAQLANFQGVLLLLTIYSLSKLFYFNLGGLFVSLLRNGHRNFFPCPTTVSVLQKACSCGIIQAYS